MSTNADKRNVPAVHTSELDNDVILDVSHVWKIYCRNLKRSMRYGLYDLARQLVGAGKERTHKDLRPGEFFAVRDADFQLRQSECCAMIGPNGAGKSTMLKMINGLIRPNAGAITIRGKAGALIELGAGFNPLLSGRENVYINGAVLGLTKNDIDLKFEEVVEFAGLGHVIDDPVKTYSSGMRVRLGFSVASNLRPELLIIDEVLAVGDVGFRMKCFAHLRKIVEEGVSIILVSHAVSMLSRVATRSIVFGKGKIVHNGDMETGMAVYQELMEYALDTQDKKREQAYGESKTIRVEDVEVRNGRGEPSVEFSTGDQLELRIRLAAEHPVPSARVIAALCSPLYGPLFSTSSDYQNVSVDLKTGENVLTLRYENLPLLIGAYYFNVAVFGNGTYEYHDRRTGIGGFRVTSPPVNADGHGITGLVKFEHTWSGLQ